MATKPTPGASDGTYGTEMNAFLDVSLASDGKVKDGAVFSTSAAPSVDAGIANKLYVDNGGQRLVDGTPTVVHTLYLLGDLDNDSSTSVAHGIGNVNKILSVTVMVFDDGVGRFRIDEAFVTGSTSWSTTITNDNVIISNVGTTIRNNAFKIRIDHTD